ncbi:MAG: hypothetical protein ACTSRA_03085 [Promethearchaeota archaeon]
MSSFSFSLDWFAGIAAGHHSFQEKNHRLSGLIFSLFSRWISLMVRSNNLTAREKKI